MSAAIVCERCGRTFEKETHRDVHPCPEQLGEKAVREIRPQFDPGQRHLDEFEQGNSRGGTDAR